MSDDQQLLARKVSMAISRLDEEGVKNSSSTGANLTSVAHVDPVVTLDFTLRYI